MWKILFVMAFEMFSCAFSDLILDEISQKNCPDASVKFYFANKGKDLNGNQIVDINFTYPFPVDDTYLVEAMSYVWKNGRWIKFFTLPGKNPACRTVNAYGGPLWHDVERLNGKSPGTCPFLGLYRLTNYKVDTKKMRIPFLPNGKLNISTLLLKQGKIIFCTDLIVKNE